MHTNMPQKNDVNKITAETQPSWQEIINNNNVYCFFDSNSRLNTCFWCFAGYNPLPWRIAYGFEQDTPDWMYFKFFASKTGPIFLAGSRNSSQFYGKLLGIPKALCCKSQPGNWSTL